MKRGEYSDDGIETLGEKLEPSAHLSLLGRECKESRLKKMLLAYTSQVPDGRRAALLDAEVRRLVPKGARVHCLPYAQRRRPSWFRECADYVGRLGCALLGSDGEAWTEGIPTEASAVIAREGNSYRLLGALYEYGLLEETRQLVEDGLPYLGFGAGASVASPTIATTTDMPIVLPASLVALNLVAFNVAFDLWADSERIPIEENVDIQIREYQRESDMPVVVLRPGSILRVLGATVEVAGDDGVRVFTGNNQTRHDPGSTLQF